MSADVTLVIEGATYQGSVALLRGTTVVAERTLSAEDGGLPRAGRGEKLMPAIAECLQESGISGAEIARIVCGAGPGSFTSLRVAGSVAKGLAVGFGVELFSVSSLMLIVAAQRELVPGPYVSLLNAMRDEFFAQRVMIEEDGRLRQMGRVGILSMRDLGELHGRETGLRLIGPGQSIDAHPHARGAAHLTEQIIAAGPVDIATWEPEYGRLAEAQVKWEAEHGRPLVP